MSFSQATNSKHSSHSPSVPSQINGVTMPLINISKNQLFGWLVLVILIIYLIFQVNNLQNAMLRLDAKIDNNNQPSCEDYLKPQDIKRASLHKQQPESIPESPSIVDPSGLTGGFDDPSGLTDGSGHSGDPKHLFIEISTKKMDIPRYNHDKAKSKLSAQLARDMKSKAVTDNDEQQIITSIKKLLNRAKIGHNDIKFTVNKNDASLKARIMINVTEKNEDEYTFYVRVYIESRE